jgi:alpha-glucoside transport system permease protein
VGETLSKIASTLITVVVAVAASGAVWIGANLIFNQVKRNWARFTMMAFAICGFVAAMLLSGNRVTRYSGGPDDGTLEKFGYWVWFPLVVAAGAAVVGFLIGRARDVTQRVIVGGAGLAALGVFAAAMTRDDYYPEVDGLALVGWTVGVMVVGAAIGLLRKRPPVGGALLGAAIGWILGAFGVPDLGTGSAGWTYVAMAVPPALVGVRVGLGKIPDATGRAMIDQRSRAVIFLAPALLFIFGALVVPTIRTIYLSALDRRSEDYVGFENYSNIFRDPKSWDTANWTDMFGSRLFWIGLVLLVVFVLLAIRGKAQTGRAVEFGSPSMGPMLLGGLFVAFAFFTTTRGTIVNNLWWVVVVTLFATSLGLAIAVLSDGAPFERIAKSLIFMPMAISLVGASVIWRFMYVARDSSQDQTGVMNALWVDLGKLSAGQDTGPSALIILLLLATLALLIGFAVRHNWIGLLATLVVAPFALWAIAEAWSAVGGDATRIIFGLAVTAILAVAVWATVRGVMRRNPTQAVVPGVLAIVLAWFLLRYWQIWGGGVGGQRTNSAGTVVGSPINFIQEPPFNNMWLMVVLIWIQTGFAMVILSAAIKAVPTEFIEAARVDGATESQIFWRVTLPQIGTTIGVVVTTLIVLVMKVYDIVQVLTNGNFGTEVLANNMYREAFLNSDTGIGAALAVLIFVSVLPIMILNIRRMQKET